MINLVSDYLRISNRYALRNSRLLRYTVVSAFTMAAIGAITVISILDMQRTQNNLQGQINNQNQKLDAYKPLETQGKQLADELSTINSLLGRQVTFSTLLPQIAKLMPPGSVLQQLNVSANDLLPATSTGSTSSKSSTSSAQQPFVIQAAVMNRDDAATLLENIKASTNLFTDADIVSVTTSLTTGTNSNTNSTPSTSTRYPYQVTINAYLKKISQGGTTK